METILFESKLLSFPTRNVTVTLGGKPAGEDALCQYLGRYPKNCYCVSNSYLSLFTKEGSLTILTPSHDCAMLVGSNANVIYSASDRVLRVTGSVLPDEFYLRKQELSPGMHLALVSSYRAYAEELISLVTILRVDKDSNRELRAEKVKTFFVSSVPCRGDLFKISNILDHYVAHGLVVGKDNYSAELLRKYCNFAYEAGVGERSKARYLKNMEVRVSSPDGKEVSVDYLQEWLCGCDFMLAHGGDLGRVSGQCWNNSFFGNRVSPVFSEHLGQLHALTAYPGEELASLAFLHPTAVADALQAPLATSGLDPRFRESLVAAGYSADEKVAEFLAHSSSIAHRVTGKDTVFQRLADIAHIRFSTLAVNNVLRNKYNRLSTDAANLDWLQNLSLDDLIF